MLIAPEGRFILVNMDWCQDLMGGLFEHVTPVPSAPDSGTDKVDIKSTFASNLKGLSLLRYESE